MASGHLLASQCTGYLSCCIYVQLQVLWTRVLAVVLEELWRGQYLQVQLQQNQAQAAQGWRVQDTFKFRLVATLESFIHTGVEDILRSKIVARCQNTQRLARQQKASVVPV